MLDKFNCLVESILKKYKKTEDEIDEQGEGAVAAPAGDCSVGGDVASDVVDVPEETCDTEKDDCKCKHNTCGVNTNSIKALYACPMIYAGTFRRHYKKKKKKSSK